jgi:hypothetical protein
VRVRASGVPGALRGEWGKGTLRGASQLGKASNLEELASHLAVCGTIEVLFHTSRNVAYLDPHHKNNPTE